MYFFRFLVRTSTGQKKVYSKEDNSIASKLLRRKFVCKELICVSEKLKLFSCFLRDIWNFSQLVEVSKFLRICPTIFRGILVGDTHCLVVVVGIQPLGRSGQRPEFSSALPYA